MKNRFLRTAVFLATATTLFSIGCGDNGASSDVRGDGNVKSLINRMRGTNDPKKPDLYTLNVIKNPTNGGSVSKSPDKEQYTSGESVLISATPETGYRFTGWSGSQTSTNTEMAVTMNGNKELIANFLPVNVVSYTLNVIANPETGGTVSKSPDKPEYASGESILVTAAPNDGYNFTGWSGASASREAAVTIYMDSNKELFANFALRTYTLTINAENGGSVSSDPGKSAYTYEDEITVTAYPADGYTFTGWSGAATGTGNPITVTMNGDKYLSANFEWQGTEPPPEVSTYTLTAYPSPANGGTVSINPNKTSYSANEPVSVTAEAAEGYRFTGWSGASGSQETGVTIVMNEDKELIANFERLAYTLTVSANPSDGGSVSRSPDYERYNYGTSVTVTATAYSGYRFTGWTGASSSTSASVAITMDGNKTVTANFEQISTYAITFNANGGTVSPISGTTGIDGRLASLPTPTRTGYTFNGWYTAAMGGTAVTTSTVFSATATIYAQWTLVTYTITFNANGGTVSPMSDTTGTRWRLASLPVPKRTCYTFNGWYTSAAGGEAVTANAVFSSDVTIYARWTVISGCTAFTDSRDGKTYKKIAIGTQTWMGENLNYNASGSICYGNSADSCAKYGRLYNWSTAMGGASSSSANPNGVQGVCPAGWHFPSDAEWTVLTDFVGGASTAGTKLKSTSGWYNWYNNDNGTDDFGWSALPGGLGISDGDFSHAGINGYWWSATETEGFADGAWSRSMNYGNEYVDRNSYYKSLLLYSVRCVQDYSSFTITFNANGGTVSPTSGTTGTDGRLASLPTPTRSGYIFNGWFTAATDGTQVTTSTMFNANTTIYARWNRIYDVFTDSRDGKTYNMVAVGGQTWMAENLNYDVPNNTTDVCYGNSADSCAKYGRLYNWATAMNGSSSSSLSPSGVQGVCPAGWHLPSDAEWTTLTDYVGGASTAGTRLKSTSGWYNNGNGTDQYGFAALPGGNGYGIGDFFFPGNGGFWWSAPEGGAYLAIIRIMLYNSESVDWSYGDKTYLFSVRCVQD